MAILGIGGLLGDAACAVLKNGELKAAVEEAKISRGFRPGQIPLASMDECLRLAGATRAEVECVAVVRPFTGGPEANLHLALRDLFPKAEIVVVEHHQAHAASAFFASPFEDAIVLTLDHSGDFRCGARWHASKNQLQMDKEWYFPDSLGRLYGSVTKLLGFRAGADEHKVQWLSASGDERFMALFREILSPAARLDPAFFDANRQSGGGFSTLLYDRLGIRTGSEVPAAIAATRRWRQRRAGRRCRRRLLALAGEGENLCLAGGLFLNALLVEFLESSGRWKNVFVQAAAGNAGTALGAVFHVWHQVRRHTRRTSDGSLLLGASYTAEEIKQVLENCKLRFQYLRSTDELLARAVGLLGEHKILAWMQGRMEFGPRALGNRSILASPLDSYSTENLNIYIESIAEHFRKFAASGSRGARLHLFRSGTQRAQSGHRRPRPPGTPQDLRIGDSGPRSGPRPRRRRGRKSAFPPSFARGRQSHRLARALQHQLQSVRRPPRLDPPRCRAEFLFLRHRRPDRGEFSAGEEISYG